ncbi:MAG TPA: alcohol dehydrogenase catalytic domain-containing protein [Polyangiales bacterium]
MLALVCADPPRLDPSHAEPVRTPGEVLLGLRLAGICDTDLQLARGYMGYRGVLGHEFVAEVLDADDTSLRGRRVVADINASCLACSECRRGQPHHCLARTVLGIVGRDGALAERFLVPAHTLVPVPDEVSDERAVFAEPLAAALHVLEDLPQDEGPCVVLGDGKLGLLIARAVAQSGRRTVVVGHHPGKLALARQGGAVGVLESELDASLCGVPAVIEATGSARGLSRALSMLRARGTLILKTTVAGASEVDLSPVVINELRVIGSRCGDMARAVDALRTLDPTPLIAARYPLADAEQAFAHAATRGTLKVLVSSGG